MSTIGGVGGYSNLSLMDFRGARRSEDQRQELFLPQALKSAERKADAASEREYQAQQATEESFARMRVALQSSAPEGVETSVEKGRLDAPLAGANEGDAALEAFKAYMAMTPAEKLRDSILKDIGMTEEEIQALPPEQQKAVEEEIAQRMQERAELQANAERSPDEQVYGVA